jgi:hypothetical protein
MKLGSPVKASRVEAGVVLAGAPMRTDEAVGAGGAAGGSMIAVAEPVEVEAEGWRGEVVINASFLMDPTGTISGGCDSRTINTINAQTRGCKIGFDPIKPFTGDSQRASFRYERIHL